MCISYVYMCVYVYIYIYSVHISISIYTEDPEVVRLVVLAERVALPHVSLLLCQGCLVFVCLSCLFYYLDVYYYHYYYHYYYYYY